MTHLLWKSYWEDDVEKFRRLLLPTGYGTQNTARSPNVGHGGAGSPGALGTSPRPPPPRLRRPSGFGTSHGGNKNGGSGLGRSEINSRDHAGLTILLRAASSTAENAILFVEALLDHPAIDIYVQDPESGWNALHRALYSGNIYIARLLLEKERKDLTGHTAPLNRVGHLIKTKDHEGFSPFDLYNATIGERILGDLVGKEAGEGDSDSEEVEAVEDSVPRLAGLNALGEDLFAFGSNRNLSLGFGDEDDRQFPDRVYLQRPEHLMIRFYNEYLENAGLEGSGTQDPAKIPALVLNRPLVIRDVVLSKLHSAVLTTDPVSNLYVCGIGRGGRLGLGDENTRFTYTSVQGPLADKKIVQVALGQNHSMAVDDTGALWTWGNNAHYQLGYALPTPTKKDEDPISTTPRQVFGPLKKEIILGIAASSVHSVAHTGTSLYCWGKNLGQLALMDADSRSLEYQQTPRKVAASLFSSPIVMVTAIDKATTILLQNHTVCVFTGYGYHIVKFPFAAIDSIGNLSMSGRYEAGRNRIQYITSGGETIAALTGRGDLFTMNLDHKIETNSPATSTTNPSKIKGAVTQPQCIWSARKDGVRSVGIGDDGTVIISTLSGAVWLRVKRAKAKDAYTGASEPRRKAFKFQRVPYITKVTTVRASPSGGFAAIRQDSDVMKEQLGIDEQSLWTDVAGLNCLEGFQATEPRSAKEDNLGFWKNNTLRDRIHPIAYEVLKSSELEQDLLQHLTTWTYRHGPTDASISTSTSPDLKVPVHGWLLAARSSVLRHALAQFQKAGSYDHSEMFTISDIDGKILVCFQGLDLVSLLNLVLFMYEDKVIPVWNFTRQAPPLAHSYRQIRLEVMKLATRLNMSILEAAARLQTDPKKCMDEDFRLAIKERRFFQDGDVLLELDGLEVPVHSTFLRTRCPWFEGLFNGRSNGFWLTGRREAQPAGSPSEKVKIDLRHMDPDAFKYVLRYLYGDFSAELFDAAVCDSFEDFLDLVMDVMGIADYLMLDRLLKICQQVMGRFANIRNIAHFLNAISPFSGTTSFRDAGMEYICLQLESMLENHLLDELDDDLLLELDEVVRDNQATQFPFAKSGRAELVLHENYPELAQDIDEERQIRVKEMAYKVHRDEERKLSVSIKGKSVSLDESGSYTPTPDRFRRAAKGSRNEPFSPSLRPKASQGDLIFDMDEEDPSLDDSPPSRPQKSLDMVAELDQIQPINIPLKGRRWKTPISFEQSPSISPSATPQMGAGAAGVSSPVTSPAQGRDGIPWARATASAAKMDLRDIIQSESTTRSALSEGLAAQKAKDGAPKPAPPKMSQKEKKKYQQAQAAQASLLSANPPKAAWDQSSGEKGPAWKVASTKTKPTSSNKPVPQDTHTLSTPGTKPLVAAEATSIPIHRRTASPDTRFSGQRTTAGSSIPISRTPAKPNVSASGGSLPKTPGQVETPAKPFVPHSKTYITPARKAEPLAGYTMEDIIVQQRREQELIKEAMAKRSLQEIQEEQAFQEWWEAESRRAQEEEAKRVEREKDKEENPKRGGRRGRVGKPRGGGSGGGRGGKGGGGDAGVAGAAASKPRGRREATPVAASGSSGGGAGRRQT